MLWCMRTTIYLEDALLADVRKTAAATGRTMTAVIEDAVRESFDRRRAPRRRIRLTTYRGRGLQPGVDLDDTASLLDRMGEPHGSR